MDNPCVGEKQPDQPQFNEIRGHFIRDPVDAFREPLLQLDPPLLAALRTRGFTVAIETNGTIPVPEGVDWICVSPKARGELVVTSGHELKLVYPQEGAEPERYRDLDFRYFSLQPMDGPDRDRNTALVHAYVEAHPEWRVSLQMHKLMGLP